MSILNAFKSTTGNWDLGRILACKVIVSFDGAFLYAVFKLHSVPNWSELGGGLALVMGGAVAFIGGKEIAIAKATATTSP